MPRRDVPFIAGEFYHLYNRGVHRNQIFHHRGEYLLFLSKWRQHISASQINIIAYCLMPNHYHILAQAGDAELSRHLHRFSLSFVKAWNRLRGQSGVAFERNFQSVHVDNEDYLLHLTRYLHRNPVQAKLVAQAGEWEFSSYPDFIGSRNGTLPAKDVILTQFASPEDYRRFVEHEPYSDVIQHLIIDDDQQE